MRNLWGRDFALVPDGLSEGDVTAFVEEMITRHKEADERLDHLDSLHRLATETVQEAQELAEHHKSEGRKQADDEAQTVIAAATERARLIVETAEKLAIDLKQDAKTESERQAASACQEIVFPHSAFLTRQRQPPTSPESTLRPRLPWFGNQPVRQGPLQSRISFAVVLIFWIESLLRGSFLPEAER